MTYGREHLDVVYNFLSFSNSLAIWLICLQSVSLSMPVGVETFPQENELMRWQTRKNDILGTFLRSPKLYHLNCYELR